VIKEKLVFIGAGNMAEALVSGLVNRKVCRPEQITLTDPLPERLACMASKYGVRTASDNAAAVREAEVVILAVKPQMMDAVLMELTGEISEGRLFISIAAGIPAARIEQRLRSRCRVVRVMPNTPALIGCGAAAFAPGTCAMESDLTLTRELIEATGLAVPVSEEQMDAVTALSGSGPAYIFYLLEAMLEAAEQMRLDPQTARQLALQTVEGAARLMAETGEAPAKLRRKVTSPGGTTEAALKVMEARGVGTGVVQGILAAQQRSRELSRG